MTDMAYVLLDVSKDIPRLIENLLAIRGVKSAIGTYGTYDVVVTVEAPDIVKLKKITDKICMFEGIKTSVVLIGM